MLKNDSSCNDKDISSFEVEIAQMMPGGYYPPRQENHDRRDRDRSHDGRDRSHDGRDRSHDGRDRSHDGRDRSHDGRDHSYDGRGRRDSRRPGGAPPNIAPPYAKSAGVYAVDPGAITGCLFKYTYIWLNNGRSFWFFPTYVGRRSVSGYRWSRFGWSYTGLDLDLIDFFTCSK